MQADRDTVTGGCGYVRAPAFIFITTLLAHACVVSRNAQAVRGQAELCCQSNSWNQLEVVCHKAMHGELKDTIIRRGRGGFKLTLSKDVHNLQQNRQATRNFSERDEYRAYTRHNLYFSQVMQDRIAERIADSSEPTRITQ